jgi:8-oxo-dGTP pyrophosphatase MutT (NUDIX family)
MNVAEPEAAVAIVVAHAPAESVLLIRRSERKEDSWSGHWSFPGGRRDPQDHDLLHTALRELEEECGIRLQREHMQSALPPVFARRRTGPFVLVAPFVFSVDGELPTVVDQQEAVAAVWMPLNVWRNFTRHSLTPVPGLPGNWLFPAIDLNGVPVWGFTYRLATDWLALLAEHTPLEAAGFAMACHVLDFLLSLGLELKHGWLDRVAQSEITNPHISKIAIVEGVIPIAQLVTHFAKPANHFPTINLLEMESGHVRIVGLAFEEYLISAF